MVSAFRRRNVQVLKPQINLEIQMFGYHFIQQKNTKKLKIATTNIVFYDEYLLTNFLSNKVARLVNTAIAINVSKPSHIFALAKPKLLSEIQKKLAIKPPSLPPTPNVTNQIPIYKATKPLGDIFVIIDKPIADNDNSEIPSTI